MKSKRNGATPLSIARAARSATAIRTAFTSTRSARTLAAIAAFCGSIAATSGCTATFDSDAEASCHSIFQAWEEAGKACNLEPTMPDPNKVCWRAYDVGESLEADCLPWIRAHKCEELDNAHFQAHCGTAIYLRTW